MNWTPYQYLLALVMLVTGSINTLSTKWADMSEAAGENGHVRVFNHPFLQSLGMFIGELSCLLVFYIAKACVGARGSTLTPATMPKFNILVFWPAALCDMVSTSLMNIGLNLTFASSFQMLRGAVIIFTALLSVAFLNRIVKCHMWLGMLTILCGLILVGLTDVLMNGVGFIDMNAVVAGDLLIIMAQIITATQMVYEERVLSKYNIPPLMAVGLEGFFGFITLGTLLIPMYYIHAGKPFSNDPDGRLENVRDAFIQMKNNWHIIVATIGNIISIAFFNFSGISVTQQISATTRMVLDSCRTLIIWVISLSLRWQPFTYKSFLMQVAGFTLLVFGMCVYNDVGITACLRRRGCLSDNDGQEDPDEFEPLLGTPDPEAHRRREVTYGGQPNVNQSGGVN